LLSRLQSLGSKIATGPMMRKIWRLWSCIPQKRDFLLLPTITLSSPVWIISCKLFIWSNYYLILPYFDTIDRISCKTRAEAMMITMISLLDTFVWGTVWERSIFGPLLSPTMKPTICKQVWNFSSRATYRSQYLFDTVCQEYLPQSTRSSRR
jgi:hypothetical protein